jgi:hypothetical protein
MIRVHCYIDGFNLYHAIDDMDQPSLHPDPLRTSRIDDPAPDAELPAG